MNADLLTTRRYHLRCKADLYVGFTHSPSVSEIKYGSLYGPIHEATSKKWIYHLVKRNGSIFSN